MVRIRGPLAVFKLSRQIYVAEKDSPMTGIENNGSYFASDVPAILKYTRRCITETRDRKAERKVTFYNIDSYEIEKEMTKITGMQGWKAGYEHFAIKEIHEHQDGVRHANNVIRT